jgi:N-acetylglutamate synthase-like GNAT family acetyltransferase
VILGLGVDSVVDHIEIVNLAARLHVAPTLAGWILAQWPHFLSPDATLETLAARLAERTTPHTIPETFVAFEGAQPIGMASLVKYDMEARRGLSPWLAGVYVLSQFRNRGIGSRLVQVVMQEARALGIERLYLFTPDKMSFYERLGWHTIERTEYHGVDVTIMSYEASA